MKQAVSHQSILYPTQPPWSGMYTYVRTQVQPRVPAISIFLNVIQYLFTLCIVFQEGMLSRPAAIKKTSIF